MKRIFLAFLFFLAVLPAGADEMDAHFKLLDKDLDGKMSRDESKIWGWPDLKFTWADLDRDDAVNLKEFKSWLISKSVRQRMLRLNGEAFAQMDSNEDGRISYKEECWCTEDLFRKLDLNKNGYLTRAEAFRKARPKLRVIRQRWKKPAKNP